MRKKYKDFFKNRLVSHGLHLRPSSEAVQEDDLAAMVKGAPESNYKHLHQSLSLSPFLSHVVFAASSHCLSPTKFTLIFETLQWFLRIEFSFKLYKEHTMDFTRKDNILLGTKFLFLSVAVQTIFSLLKGSVFSKIRVHIISTSFPPVFVQIVNVIFMLVLHPPLFLLTIMSDK